MEFVRENPRNIEEYADILVDEYKGEVINIYKKSIMLRASSSVAIVKGIETKDSGY
ncbi:hypothetical protein [Caldisalinibacter kiritimatiensis]|uniref:Uncharacterized protein n=1 Tax=Caldisalinibacter kiritimatiensis TaxID=1304284 RepID=R1ASQ8_9FIRM|nr:hypothetical protein [Caldisalinibacter kiritimatiensis]EOC99701.1 hypothetical protein L21TH_2273 [Caldisalinibacter kiritimatiensis]